MAAPRRQPAYDGRVERVAPTPPRRRRASGSVDDRRARLDVVLVVVQRAARRRRARPPRRTRAPVSLPTSSGTSATRVSPSRVSLATAILTLRNLGHRTRRATL